MRNGRAGTSMNADACASCSNGGAQAPASADGLGFIAAYEEGAGRLRLLIDEGRAAELRSALLLAPRAHSVDDAMFLIAGGLAVPEGASLVLNTSRGGAAWTVEGFTPLPDAAAFRAHAETSPVWFVMGDPVAPQEAAGATAVNMLTFESTFAALYDVRFDTGEPYFDLAGRLTEEPESRDLREMLAGEPNVALPPIRVLTATIRSPRFWAKRRCSWAACCPRCATPCRFAATWYRAGRRTAHRAMMNTGPWRPPWPMRRSLRPSSTGSAGSAASSRPRCSPRRRKPKCSAAREC
jgi:hypothetical protein